MKKKKYQVKFQCFKGKHVVRSREWKIVTLRNKRKAYKAKCPKHNVDMFKFKGKEE